MVGFTKLSSERSADFVLGLLSDLFAKFDGLAEGYGVHKVKTIGEQRSRPLRAARASSALSPPPLCCGQATRTSSAAAPLARREATPPTRRGASAPWRSA